MSNDDFIENSLAIAGALIELITNRAEPYYDVKIQRILHDLEHEIFRDSHPVALFSAIRFVDELAQLIPEKRIAEMPKEQAWIWEMQRVFDLVGNALLHNQVTRNSFVVAMSARLLKIIKEERGKYESP